MRLTIILVAALVLVLQAIELANSGLSLWMISDRLDGALLNFWPMFIGFGLGFLDTLLTIALAILAIAMAASQPEQPSAPAAPRP